MTVNLTMTPGGPEDGTCRRAALLLATEHILQMPETFAGLDDCGFPIVNNVRTYAAEERFAQILDAFLLLARQNPGLGVGTLLPVALQRLEVATFRQIVETEENIRQAPDA